MALVNSDNRSPDSVELKGINESNSSPPAWADALEETQYILSRLKIKLDSLIELHGRHLTRPTLDDTSQVIYLLIVIPKLTDIRNVFITL